MKICKLADYLVYSWDQHLGENRIGQREELNRTESKQKTQQPPQESLVAIQSCPKLGWRNWTFILFPLNQSLDSGHPQEESGMGGKVALLGWGKSQKVTQLGYWCQQSQQLGEWVLQGWTGDLGDTYGMHSSQLYCQYCIDNIGFLESLLSWLGDANALVMTLSRKRLSLP